MLSSLRIQDGEAASIKTIFMEERERHTTSTESFRISMAYVLISSVRGSHVAVPGQRSSILMCSELKNWYLSTAWGPPCHSTVAHDLPYIVWFWQVSREIWLPRQRLSEYGSEELRLEIEPVCGSNADRGLPGAWPGQWAYPLSLCFVIYNMKTAKPVS